MSYLLRHTYHRLVACAVAVLFLVLASEPVVAAGKKADRQAREGSARAACLDGNYSEGVAILSKLFVETKDATYIFNQGRCFEQNRRYEDAISRFQEYLRAGRKALDDSARAEAEQHINDCKEMLAQERRTSPPPQVAQPLVASPASAVSQPPAPPPPEAEPTLSKPARKAVSASDGAGLRIGGVLVAAFGAVAAGAGLAFNLKANSIVNDMYNAPDGYTKESDRKTYETVAWVGYGVGAACVATGVILYAVGRKAQSHYAGDVALLPMAGPDRAGAVFAGAFQ